MIDLDPCLAIVPARGGSKGLPGKNIKVLAGLPLLVHSLRCAALAPRIARTIVSTDSEAIAEVARAHGADVPFMRPAELARDDTPMLPVLRHAVGEVERLEGRAYGSVLLLDPTSPGRFPEDIAQAFELLAADPSADGVIACSRPTFNPFWVGMVRGSDGALSPAFPEAQRYERRQDVPAFYRINGSLYLWRRAFVEHAQSAASGRQLLLETPEARAFSIDDAYEFELASILLERGLIDFPWLRRPA